MNKTALIFGNSDGIGLAVTKKTFATGMERVWPVKK